MNSKSKHFDARGHSVLSWDLLKKSIRDPKSIEILRSHMLYQLVICPYIELRVRVPFDGYVEVVHYGTGTDTSKLVCVEDRGIEALRRLYKNAWRRGWEVGKGVGYVSFRREARAVIQRGRVL